MKGSKDKYQLKLKYLIKSCKSEDFNSADLKTSKTKHFIKKTKKIEKKLKKLYLKGKEKDIDEKHAKKVEKEGPPEYPYEVDKTDHCETSQRAYEDICEVLEMVASKLGKSRETIKIYDPYYCNGKVIKQLGKLGFTNVHNKCEDFYER